MGLAYLGLRVEGTLLVLGVSCEKGETVFGYMWGPLFRVLFAESSTAGHQTNHHSLKPKHVQEQQRQIQNGLAQASVLNAGVKLSFCQ